MAKIWIGLGVIVVVVGVAAAALLGAFDRSPPVATATQPAPGSSPGSSPAAPPPEAGVTADDRVLGDPDAPVTIIEYASLTCPHCATYHRETLPKVQAEYIDAGKVKVVYRDFPLDRVALAAAGLARCVPPERYFPFLSVLFDSQASWATAADPLAALGRLGKTAGLSDEEVARCTTDDAHLDAVLAQRLAGEDRHQIRSTPSFVIGGRTYSGNLTFAQVQEIVEPLLP
ncbi:MAG: DsbA family protein [Alphaproteobacteria bacterium]